MSTTASFFCPSSCIHESSLLPCWAVHATKIGCWVVLIDSRIVELLVCFISLTCFLSLHNDNHSKVFEFIFLSIVQSLELRNPCRDILWNIVVFSRCWCLVRLVNLKNVAMKLFESLVNTRLSRVFPCVSETGLSFSEIVPWLSEFVPLRLSFLNCCFLD